MKRIKYLIVAVFALLVTVSCEDKSKQLFSDFQQGAIPLFTQGTDDTGFIDLSDFSASNIAFSLATEGLAEVSSVDLTITYNNAVTGSSNVVTYANVTSFPSDVSITFDQLIAAFSSNVLTSDSLDLGDSFVIGGNMQMVDGRYLDGGYSPSVLNRPVLLTYTVACASDLDGTYDLTLVSGDNGELASKTNQTITRVGVGYYEISDVSMEVFPDTPIKYRFTDICGQLIPDAESVDFGDQATLKFNAGTKIDPETGVITFEIEYISPSCCGLEGIVTIFKATPK